MEHSGSTQMNACRRPGTNTAGEPATFTPSSNLCEVGMNANTGSWLIAFVIVATDPGHRSSPSNDIELNRNDSGAS